MELTLSNGRGYSSAERNKWSSQPIGVIPIDSIFTPIKKVNYVVEDTRVGQITDYDKLTFEVWTDGTIDAAEALSSGAEILMDHLSLFTSVLHSPKEEHDLDQPDQGVQNYIFETAIEDLDFSVRTYNCLKRASINTVGDLVARTEADMMKVRNLGKKSLEEVVLKLEEMDLGLAEPTEA